MRASGTPHLLAAQGKATTLERIPMGGSGVQESRLQALLDVNPSILPVDKFEGTFAPLASLGREVMGIDNLFFSPNGRLTVVEPKLWRNPQATPPVLAQLLEYATRLTKLS